MTVRKKEKLTSSGNITCGNNMHYFFFNQRQILSWKFKSNILWMKVILRYIVSDSVFYLPPFLIITQTIQFKYR